MNIAKIPVIFIFLDQTFLYHFMVPSQISDFFSLEITPLFLDATLPEG